MRGRYLWGQSGCRAWRGGSVWGKLFERRGTPAVFLSKKMGAPRPKRRTLRWKIPTKGSLLDYVLVPAL